MILSMKAIQDIKLEGNQMELPVPQLQNPESNKQSSKAQVPRQLANRRSSVPNKPLTPQILSHIKTTRTELVHIVSKSKSHNRICNENSEGQENLNQIEKEKRANSFNNTADYEARLKAIMDENKQQKKEINELKLELKMSADIEMTNEELKRKLREADAKESELSDEISELRKLNDDNYLENNNLKDRLKMVESRSSESIENLKREIEMLKRKNKEEVDLNAKLKSHHLDDLKLKDEKLSLLKKQIAASFKDNSWERQLQLEDMSKELKRVQEECIDYKRRLNQPNEPKSACKNCHTLVVKLDEKVQLAELREKQIQELGMIMKKFQSNAAMEKELLGLVAANKQYSDVFPGLKSTLTTQKNIFHSPLENSSDWKSAGKK